MICFSRVILPFDGNIWTQLYNVDCSVTKPLTGKVDKARKINFLSNVIIEVTLQEKYNTLARVR